MKRIGVCRHFNGVGVMGEEETKKCEAGVCYREHAGKENAGWIARLPCIKTYKFSKATKRALEEVNLEEIFGEVKVDTSIQIPCDKYEDPTEEDILKEDEEIRKATEAMEKVFPIIVKIKQEHEKDTEPWVGTETCPVCNGTLHVSHANYNGHVWGKCETKNCVNWME